MSRNHAVDRLPSEHTADDALSHLHRAANAIRQHLEQAVLRHVGLTWTGFVVLRAIHPTGRIETRHAAEHAGISKATLSGVADTLVRRGLVRRVGHPTDRRLVLLELTEPGRELVCGLLPAVGDEEVFTVARSQTEQLRQLSSVLRGLIEHLGTDEARHRRS